LERNTGFEPATFALARQISVSPTIPKASAGLATATPPSDETRAATGGGFQISHPSPALREPFSTRLLPGIRANLSALSGSWLTVREAAALLKVSTATIYKLCRIGTLPFTRVLHAIRIPVAGLRAFTDRGHP
jgi:excisionase family DNA binding protein